MVRGLMGFVGREGGVLMGKTCLGGSNGSIWRNHCS